MDTPELGSLLPPTDDQELKEGTANLTVDVQEGVDPSTLVQIEMSEDQCREWQKRVEDSDARIKQEAQSWKILLEAYLPVVRATGAAEDVNSNIHFRNVHTKLPQMFVKVPVVSLEPAPNSAADDQQPGPPDPTTGQPQILTMADLVSVKQEILNKRLGRDGIGVSQLFDRINFDILAWAGLGCSKLGYRAVTTQVQQPVMGPDPTFVPPAPPPMGAPAPMGLPPTPQPPQVPQMDPMTGQPQMQTVPVTLFEEIYWRHLDPMKLIADSMCYSTQFDKDAGFMGHHFSMLPPQAASAFGIDEAELTGGTDELRYKHKAEQGEGPQVITGWEVFYKAALFLPNESHPWKLVQLVFLDHIKDKPVVHRFCQDQTFTDQGELTDESIDRFPIRVCTIRDVAGSAFPPSDSAFTNNLVKQLNTIRQQGVALRDAAIGKVLFDGGKLEDGDVAKVRNAKPGDWIEVAEGALDKGKESVATTISQPQRTNDDYRLDDMLQHNADETLGISANTSGATEDTVRSATEIQAVQKGVAGRAEKERQRVIDHFLEGVRLIDILIMRWTSQTQWVKVTGQDGATRMQSWNGKMVSGRFLYDLAIDSQRDVDTAQDRQQNLNLYNMIKGDPLVNRVPVLQKLFRSFGYDPSKCVMTPQQQMASMQPPHADHQTDTHEATKSGGLENSPGAQPQR